LRKKSIPIEREIGRLLFQRMQFQRKKETFKASFFKRRRELLERVARKTARVSRRKSLALLNFEERETSLENLGFRTKP
jgi:hypothetical protein